MSTPVNTGGRNSAHPEKTCHTVSATQPAALTNSTCPTFAFHDFTCHTTVFPGAHKGDADDTTAAPDVRVEAATAFDFGARGSSLAMTSTAGPTHLSCVLQLNCRGLTGKLGELKYHMRIGQLSAWALLLKETNCAPQISEFSVHTSPSIRDRRGVRPDIPPGKAIVYVRSHLPQNQVPLPAWCTAWQEVAAVRVRLSHSEVILVSYYARPSSGHASRIRLGWLSHLRHNFPGVPILVCGDFNAPHGSWGYPRNSSRGQLVEDTFRGGRTSNS